VPTSTRSARHRLVRRSGAAHLVLAQDRRGHQALVGAELTHRLRTYPVSAAVTRCLDPVSPTCPGQPHSLIGAGINTDQPTQVTPA